MIPSSEDHLANDRVIRQHSNDELANEQVGDIGRRLDAQGIQLLSLFGPTNVADYASACGGKIGRNRRSHPTEADESHVTGLYCAPALTRALLHCKIGNPGRE